MLHRVWMTLKRLVLGKSMLRADRVVLLCSFSLSLSAFQCVSRPGTAK